MLELLLGMIEWVSSLLFGDNKCIRQDLSDLVGGVNDHMCREGFQPPCDFLQGEGGGEGEGW